MVRKQGVILIFLAFLLLMGCSSPAQEPEANPAPTGAEPGSTAAPAAAETPAGFYGSDQRTGTASVDRVIAALVSKESKALLPLLSMSQLPCSARQGQGMPSGPPCPEGKADGTLIEVFAHGACEPEYLFARDQVDQLVTKQFSQPHYVYAVYKRDGSDWPYGIVVGTGEQREGAAIHLNTKGSVVQISSCGGPENMVPAQGASFLLPPLAQK